jgi:colicin import membrane protein
MAATAHRLEFSPPPPPGQGRAWGMAVLAHVVLLAALTWGITWQHQDTTLTAEAELWSAQVQQAAPPLQEAPPPPPPPVATPAPPPPPAVREADIALEREKKRLELEKKKQDAEKADAKKKAEAEKKRLDEQKKREAQDKAKARALEEAEAKRAEMLRQENLRRMQGLAGATGAANATGNATQSSGPSDSYAGRIRARIKPNIVFTDDVAGNPVTEVEVRMAPDGTITQRRITKQSTSKTWDEAVLRALDRTAKLPTDLDGRVHTPLIMTFRPRD